MLRVQDDWSQVWWSRFQSPEKGGGAVGAQGCRAVTCLLPGAQGNHVSFLGLELLPVK